ncbi:hypothetical protein B0H19DRAFT_1264420 [Mycena capillaripes]|nr:hypothetical protein B0H19DRAFT_1264420 [Mycena capillaripes]
MPYSLTSRMTIYWGITLPMSFTDGLAALSLSKVDVIKLHNLIGTWDCKLVSAIAAASIYLASSGCCSEIFWTTVRRSNTTWGISCGVWFPNISVASHHRQIDTTAMRYLKWFFRTFATSPSLPQHYHLFAQCMAGEDGFLAVRRAIERNGYLPDFVFTSEDVRGSKISFVPDDSETESESDTKSNSASDES